MIDIILTICTKTDSLKKILLSILLQTINDKITLIVVDNSNNSETTEIISMFRDKINIKYLNSTGKKTIQELRRIGLDNSVGENFMFLDENTILYDSFSVCTLYNKLISEKHDMVFGNSVMFSSDTSLNIFFDDTIYSKLFNKKFLEKHGIKYTDKTNDYCYISKCSILSDNIGITDGCICVYENINYEVDPVELVKNRIKVLKENPSDKNVYYIQETINFIYNHIKYNTLENEKKLNAYLKELKELYANFNI
jgi:hypothetical protein